MTQIDTLNKDDFEQVVYFNDKRVGLKAIVAIHDTTLGPATGGCRFFPYRSEEEALTDVLRLAKGMTYKSAISHIAFGGGKSVILGDPRRLKTEALLERFGEYINSLGGRYITAKDVNIDSHDLQIISRKTKHILGIEGVKNSSGDPSPATAFGILQGIRALNNEVLGKKSLDGISFAIQGVGAVGHYLAMDLYKEGAKLTICDVDRQGLDACLGKVKAHVVEPKEIYDVQSDFFVPCAMGAVINSETIPRLKCKIVAGAANNQLATLQDGYELFKRDIFYAPDYVINAGGIINIAYERGGYDHQKAFNHVGRIYQTMVEIIQRTQREKIPPFIVANKMVEEILDHARKH